MSIQKHLNKIRNAVYGREARESIAKGIETAYDDASEKDNANMEVKMARGTNPNLNARLNKVEEVDRQTTAQLAETAQQLKDISVNVKDYGAKGDWDGIMGTDNLAAFNNAVNALPSTGGEILIPDGDYWLSDSWNIDKENVSIKIMSGATIRTTTPTTGGHTLGFIGYIGSGTTTTPQRKKAKIYGGGTVLNSSNGTNENAVAAVRYDGFTCTDINISVANRKAVTCQYGVNNIRIKNINIGTTGNSGISVETACKNIEIDSVSIKKSGGKGIVVTSETATTDMANVKISNIHIVESVDDGVYADKFDNLSLDNINLGIVGMRGVLVGVGDVAFLSKITINESVRESVVVDGIKILVDIDALYMFNPSKGNSNIYNGLNLLNIDNVSLSVKNCRLKGTTHNNAVNIGDSPNNLAVFEGNQFDKGLSDGNYNYSGWIPLIIKDIFGGQFIEVKKKKRIVHGSAMPTSGQWASDDYVLNTTKSILGTAPNRYILNGWRRITNSSNNVLNTDWVEDRSNIGA